MIELNPQTAGEIVKIVIRRKDGALSLMASGDKREDPRFNLHPSAFFGHSGPRDDRLVFGERIRAEAVVSLLEKVIGKRFLKDDFGSNEDYEVFVRQD